MNFEKISAGKKSPEVVNALVEIPKGSQNKYEFDKELGVIRLDRAFYSAVYSPLDYGFIPQTLSEDGDPLDILVMGNEPLVPGCLVEARPVGLLKMIDSGEPDSKVLAVQEKNPRFATIKDLEDIEKFSPHLLEEIGHYFETYKHLQGKEVKVAGWENKSAAEKEILASQERYQQDHKN
ncbi:MAG: Inorganic pyrophosphatase [Parcubacteria group bacterium GW2011_GWC1_45_9]|nr:MAG: Inorganic pyrophosphatase [Parcubacteria group bacterium GW2011_GWB1_45_10]KKU17369.1 MAG: Inorganic pyrophosphatase [Parcubacteria group bacterium GW2011_GWC1_45_9]